ncbi:MAG: hypothetical protein Q9184_000663 [Pyrenodesmia sp. 2 TL-2023]
MSSSKAKPVKKAAAPPAKVPDFYTSPSARMSFASDRTLNVTKPVTWQVLEGDAYPGGHNVGPIKFQRNLSIGQKTKGGAGKCTVLWSARELVPDPQVKRGAKDNDDFESRQIQVDFFDQGSLELAGDVELASQLPLARLYKTIRSVRLVLEPAKFKHQGGTAPKGVEGKRGHLLALLSGIHSHDPSNVFRQMHEADTAALALEHDAQVKKLGSFVDVTLVTSRGKNDRIVVVKVYREELGTTDEQEGNPVRYGDDQEVGQSYFIYGSELFKIEEDIQELYPILGGGRRKGWRLDVSKASDCDTTGALFVGYIVNSFARGDIHDFINKVDKGVTLGPVVIDVQGDRAVNAGSKRIDDINEESKARYQFLTDPESLNRQKSKIPLDTLFAGLPCNPAENELVPGDVQLPPTAMAKLNASQANYCKMAYKSKVSVAVGPPGTGKSSTLGGLIYSLVEKDGEKVAGLAVSMISIDVAVQALLKSAMKTWEALRPGTNPPFVHVFSESTILRQWVNGQIMTGQCHLDFLRYKIAYADQAAYPGYWNGHKELERFGRIDDINTYDAYCEEAEVLTQMVLDNAMGVFCTIATSMCKAVYMENSATRALERYFRAKTICVDEAGTLHRPYLLIPIMAFPDAHRLVLGGDPSQVPAYVGNKKTYDWWPKSYLNKIMEWGYPSVMLDVQYRMHHELYAHLIGCIYKRFISSAYLSTQPSPFLQRLAASQPRAHVNGGDYKLESFLHFVDVAEGVRQRNKSKSSFNTAEVDVVDALVRDLITRCNVEKSDIGVMTGYKAQAKLLREKAKLNGWLDWADV